MNDWLTTREERELECPASNYCPLAPCYRCLRNERCESFSIYRKEHPEYDVKYTHYVTTYRSHLRALEEQPLLQLKQRGLCVADERKRVSQHECHRFLNDLGTEQGKSNTIQKETVTMKLDFSEVTELESKLIEEGEHVLTIKAAKEQKSKNGTNMLVLDLVSEDDGFTRDNVCLEGPGAFRAKQLATALGMDEDTFAGMDASDLVGLTVTAKIEVEEYEGRDYSKVKKYLA